MSPNDVLTDQELATLDTWLAPHTFAGLFEQYGHFVRSLGGYEFTIYDYDNDVSTRVMLQRAIDASPVDVQFRAWALLHPLDETFLMHTRQVDRTRYPKGSWHERIPTNPLGELKQDIDGGRL